MKKAEILKKAIIKENAVLVYLLGLCPALAVSTMAENAIGLGLATTFVLVGSNLVISLLRKIIPNKTRIPCFIVLSASFTVIVEMIVEAFAYKLYLALGVFLPLIAINCVIFARAEIFASKNRPLDAVVDAIGTGAGFTLAMLAIATVREILGSGQWFGISLPWLAENNAAVFSLAPGGFIVFACLIAAVNKVTKSKAGKRDEFSCVSCPSALVCGKRFGDGGDE